MLHDDRVYTNGLQVQQNDASPGRILPSRIASSCGLIKHAINLWQYHKLLATIRKQGNMLL